MPATIAFFKQLQAQLIVDIEALQSGRYELIRIEAGQRTDASHERLAELRHRLGNLDQVIAIFEQQMVEIRRDPGDLCVRNQT